MKKSAALFGALGSSPLARGPHRFPFAVIQLAGLIPARAGTTRADTGSVFPARAHPRSRGDHSYEKLFAPARQGSSPLARGPLHDVLSPPNGVGLIPARAGTTLLPFPCEAGGGAHPRSRGDHIRAKKVRPADSGSSPLARGPQRRMGKRKHGRGLIPARAGTTVPCQGTTETRRAHPRSRGDHLIMRIAGRWERGSSPLARGPRRVIFSPLADVGLIPARAGTTAERPGEA